MKTFLIASIIIFSVTGCSGTMAPKEEKNEQSPEKTLSYKKISGGCKASTNIEGNFFSFINIVNYVIKKFTVFVVLIFLVA